MRPAECDPPRLSRAQFMTMRGLEAVRALAEGRAAPPSVATTLGLDLFEVGEGLADGP
jgi:hypothetical protein